MATANVILLAVLAALLLLLLALWTAKPALAHFFGGDSVVCGRPNGCEIRYSNSSRYGDAVAHGQAAWNNLGRVRIMGATNRVIDVRIFDTTNMCAATWVGRTTVYGGSTADTIEFNVCNFNQSNYTDFERKGTATHEFGHTLGLNHSYIPNVMHSPSRETERNTPQSHDREDYYTAPWR